MKTVFSLGWNCILLWWVYNDTTQGKTMICWYQWISAILMSGVAAFPRTEEPSLPRWVSYPFTIAVIIALAMQGYFFTALAAVIEGFAEEKYRDKPLEAET